MKITANSIFKFLIVLLFMDAYVFFIVEKRDITPFYIGAIFLIAIVPFRFNVIISGVRQNVYASLMLLYMIFMNLITRRDVFTSFLISVFCWSFYIISFRRTTTKEFCSTLRLFQKLMNLMAVYGIYQIFAYYYSLPFADLSIPGFMADGYNWGNMITVGSLQLRRSNAIFREPSFYSQFLALNILIYVQSFIDTTSNQNKHLSGKKTHNLRWIVINGIALICAFSGTGLFMFLGGIILLLITNKGRAVFLFVKKHSPLIVAIIAIIVAVFLVPNPITKYLFGRLSEFNSDNVSSISGYLRMILPYQVAIDIILHNNPLFGVGFGNTIGYITTTSVEAEYSVTELLPSAFASMGLIGGILTVLFLAKCWNKNNIRVGEYRALLIGIYLMTFMHGTWSSEVYWLLLGLTNVHFTDLCCYSNTHWDNHKTEIVNSKMDGFEAVKKYDHN